MKKLMFGVAGGIGLVSILVGVWQCTSDQIVTKTIIGGADGPTSIYIAGKVDNSFLGAGAIGFGVCLLVGLGAAIYLGRKRSR